jgi:CSLREA domain-containing protein
MRSRVSFHGGAHEHDCPCRAARVARALAVLTLGMFAACATAATITVNSNADTVANDGVCTLREAIVAANTDTASGAMAGECAAGSGTDTIVFAIPGAGVHTITLTGALPNITTPMTIDGYTQSGASANTLAVGDNAVLQIEINGNAITNPNAWAFHILGGGNTRFAGSTSTPIR